MANRLKYAATLETLQEIADLVEANLVFTGLTNKEAAEKIGVNPAFLTRFLSGRSAPSFESTILVLKWLEETDPEGKCFKLVKRMIKDG